MNRLRSLNIEHVSPAVLIGREISRDASSARQGDETVGQGTTLPDKTMLALMRRWFWSRKPDAGFALEGFPATLLQAKVFDEWLDARDESVHGVLVAPGYENPVVDHYRTLGLLIEDEQLAVA